MKASKEKNVIAARDAKRRLENPLTEVQKSKIVVDEAERQRKIKRTADKKCERPRIVAKGRCTAGVEGLAVERDLQEEDAIEESEVDTEQHIQTEIPPNTRGQQPPSWAQAHDLAADTRAAA